MLILKKTPMVKHRVRLFDLQERDRVKGTVIGPGIAGVD
jgi:hypothetical protein